jgi:hypothetical protein
MLPRIRCVFRFLALAALVCVLPVCRAAAASDSFVGTHTVTMAYDENISDGLSLSYEDANVEITTSDAVTYTLTPPGMTMTRTGNELELDLRPQSSDPCAVILNSYALAEGSLGAILYLGQDPSAAADLHIRVGTWGTGITATSAQLAGLWQGTLIVDEDLADDPSAPFTVVNSVFTVTDLGSNHILLDFGGGMSVNATISGNVIVPTDPSFDHFRMITDGTTFVVAAINEEDIVGALGKVSSGIAVATLIPEPATLGLLGCAGLMLLGRRRQT